MDPVLERRLRDLTDHSDVLELVEGEFLLLDGETESLRSDLMLLADGSNEMKKAKALASQEYRHHISKVVNAKKRFNHERRKYDILDKAFTAEYLSLKRLQPLIDKHGAD